MSHCERGEVSHPDLRFTATHRYIPHEKSSKVNKHIQREGENRWKQELFYIRSVFMLSLWHQEHLALASLALRLLTSNGLFRASQRGLFVYHQWKPVIAMWQQYFKLAPQRRRMSTLSCGFPQGSLCYGDLTAQLLSHFPTQVSVSSETTEKSWFLLSTRKYMFVKK